VYYYAIGIDPVARGGAHELIDLAAHRYGHPAYGWLAWLASFGRPELVPWALFVLNVIAMGVTAYFVALMAREFFDASPWWGLMIAANPGLLFAVTADTSEALSAAVLAVSLWLWLKGRFGVAAFFLAFLCFFKYQLLLVPIGLGLWEVLRFLRGERDGSLRKLLPLLAIGPGLFLVWQFYVHSVFGEWPTGLGPEFLSIPPIGFLETIGQLGNIKQPLDDASQLVAAQLPIVMAVFAITLVGLVRCIRFRNELESVLILQLLFVLALNDWTLYFPKDMIRALAIPFALMFAVFAAKNPGARPYVQSDPIKLSPSAPEVG
jgi:hypothetical protein